MSKFSSVTEYLSQIPEERKEYFDKLRSVINDNIPSWFEECINYNMLWRVVPHETYPDGYHCDPKLPLPFMNLANQKNFIALYHMGVYSDSKLLEWFQEEYAKVVSTKLDMGKSCIRFKKMETIPYELIGELVKKISVDQWIQVYEQSQKK